MDRLDQLKQMLDASLKGGKPKPGYKLRADALRAEISRLETARAGTSQDSAGTDATPAS